MPVCMAGVDHTKADLDVRSRFSMTQRRMAEVYEDLRKTPAISGAVIISTCNRMELWLSAKDENTILDPARTLCEIQQIPYEEYQNYLITRREEEAVSHLFRVSAGLESKIIGEDQIITQVGDALSYAHNCYAADHTLEVLFRQAVTGGKRVKTETRLTTADRSVIHTALDMLLEKGFSPEGKKCLVIGNGMMGKLSAQTLLDRGGDVTVTIRQYRRGIVDVPFGAARINYDDRYTLIPSCDLVVSATSSPNPTLRIKDMALLNPDHPILCVDLAVPRDIETEVGKLPWATLYDIDAFQIDLKSSQMLMQNIRKAEEILTEEENDFYSWYQGQDLFPRIQSLKEKAARDVLARMSGPLRHLDLEEDQKQKLAEEIQGAGERMMNHLLFGMREKLSPHMFQKCLSAMEDLL